MVEQMSQGSKLNELAKAHLHARVRPIRIQSLARADAILDFVVELGAPSLTQICSALGLQKNTTFYLLEALTQLGFLEKNTRSKRYSLGIRTLQLGRACTSRQSISGFAQSSLRRLALTTKETLNLGLPRMYDVLVVDSIEGTHGVRVISHAGMRAFYHASALGKAMLANFEPAARSHLYETFPLERVTENTITCAEKLEEELCRVRQKGFSVDMAEGESGVHCVAAAIFNGLGDVAGAISISGPKQRITEHCLSEWAKEVQSEAQFVTNLLNKKTLE